MEYIYITSRGHSGSTVLDAMLGNSKSIESVGELVSGMGKYDHLCSCGEKMKECEYWTTVREQFEAKSGVTWNQFVTDTKNYAHIKRFIGTLIGISKSEKELSSTTNLFTETILDVAGKEAVLDSSKTPNRALFLAKYYPNSKIIHLVKNPDGILASHYWRIKKGQGFRFLRHNYRNQNLAPLYLSVGAISWTIGNLLTEIIGLVRPSKVLRLKYEDLGTDPEAVFKKLSEFLELDLTDILNAILNGHSLSFGHNIGGNGVRHKKSFVFDSKQGTKRPLPKGYKVMVRLFCWPLMWRYGYKVFSL